MKTFHLDVCADLKAENLGDAAHQIAQHFIWLELQYRGSGDLPEPEIFLPPTTVDLKPVEEKPNGTAHEDE